jgi:hypothetical protein
MHIIGKCGGFQSRARNAVLCSRYNFRIEAPQETGTDGSKRVKYTSNNYGIFYKRICLSDFCDGEKKYTLTCKAVSVAFTDAIFTTLRITQYRCGHLPYRIQPTLDTKCGKCGQNLIYVIK